VLNEQRRQRQSSNGKHNAENLQLVSLKATEWFRIRAFKIAKMDARAAREAYLSHPEVLRVI